MLRCLFLTPALECRQTDSGADYKGLHNVTNNGQPCADWQFISTKNYNFSDYEFPDGNISDVRNFCRSPPFFPSSVRPGWVV